MTVPLTQPLPPARGTQAGEPYESPRLIVLGTLAQLTAGGNVSGQSDGFGAAGGSGVL
jgi:hypothetical protein